MVRARAVIGWLALLIFTAFPVIAAAMSPLLAWREPVYIVAGFAGVLAMVILLFQPLLAFADLPGISAIRARQIHGWVGVGLVVLIFVHVAGLWITSPPDVIDALLFVSATPFSLWGVIAMWALFATGALVLFRRKLPLQALTWRRAHRSLAALIVITSVVHALMIDGTMETITKWLLCIAVMLALLRALTRAKRVKRASV